MLTIYLKRTHSCGIQITDNVYILTAVARPGCYFGILLIIPVCVRFPLITNEKSHAHDFRNHDSHFFLVFSPYLIKTVRSTLCHLERVLQVYGGAQTSSHHHNQHQHTSLRSVIHGFNLSV